MCAEDYKREVQERAKRIMPALVILAAGIGSRYGKEAKQLAPIGPKGETLMEYSIQDALAAGFGKIVFVINRNIYNEFHATVVPRISKQYIRWAYVVQDIPQGRAKPMGTGQAIMLCRDVIDEPFAVINADDYYGAEAYRKAYAFLCGEAERYGMIGYALCNTLSDNGGVTRGVCVMDDAGHLEGIKETKNIKRIADRIEDGTGQRFDGDEIVAMNFWLLPSSFIGIVKERYEEFVQRMNDPKQDECLLPNIVDDMIRNDNVVVEVIKTNAMCYGMTHKGDTEAVRKNILRETIPPRGV